MYRGKPQTPILDAILEEPIRYHIRDLSLYPLRSDRNARDLGRTRPSRFEGFEKLPGHGVSDRVRLVSTTSQISGEPLTLHCTPTGLPAYSEDPNARAVFVTATGPDGSGIRFSVFTGNDLEGYWPDPLQSPSNWVAPLRAVERAVSEMIVSQEAYGVNCP